MSWLAKQINFEQRLQGALAVLEVPEKVLGEMRHLYGLLEPAAGTSHPLRAAAGL